MSDDNPSENEIGHGGKRVYKEHRPRTQTNSVSQGLLGNLSNCARGSDSKSILARSQLAYEGDSRSQFDNRSVTAFHSDIEELVQREVNRRLHQILYEETSRQPSRKRRRLQFEFQRDSDSHEDDVFSTRIVPRERMSATTDNPQKNAARSSTHKVKSDHVNVQEPTAFSQPIKKPSKVRKTESAGTSSEQYKLPPSQSASGSKETRNNENQKNAARSSTHKPKSDHVNVQEPTAFSQPIKKPSKVRKTESDNASSEQYKPPPSQSASGSKETRNNENQKNAARSSTHKPKSDHVNVQEPTAFSQPIKKPSKVRKTESANASSEQYKPPPSQSASGSKETRNNENQKNAARSSTHKPKSDHVNVQEPTAFSQPIKKPSKVRKTESDNASSEQYKPPPSQSASGVRRSTRKSVRPSRYSDYSMLNTPKELMRSTSHCSTDKKRGSAKELSEKQTPRSISPTHTMSDVDLTSPMKTAPHRQLDKCKVGSEKVQKQKELQDKSINLFSEDSLDDSTEESLQKSRSFNSWLKSILSPVATNSDLNSSKVKTLARKAGGGKNQAYNQKSQQEPRSSYK